MPDFVSHYAPHQRRRFAGVRLPAPVRRARHNSYYLVGLAGIQLSQKNKRRNSLQSLGSRVCGRIRTHNSIGTNPLAWFRAFDARTRGKSMWIPGLVGSFPRLLPGSTYYVDFRGIEIQLGLSHVLYSTPLYRLVSLEYV